MKYVIVLCLAFACTPKSKEEIKNSVISTEVEAVDAMLQKDQQRMDSMERILIDPM